MTEMIFVAALRAARFFVAAIGPLRAIVGLGLPSARRPPQPASLLTACVVESFAPSHPAPLTQ
eukprot:8102468-Pyramimonas_sp.AAC.2